MDNLLGFIERLLTQWGPLALGWPIAMVCCWALWRLGKLYVDAVRQSGEGAAGMSQTLQSLSDSTSTELAAHRQMLATMATAIDGLATAVKDIERTTRDTNQMLARATKRSS